MNAPSTLKNSESSKEFNRQVRKGDLYSNIRDCDRCKADRDQRHVELLLSGVYGAKAAKILGISRQLEADNRARFEKAAIIKRKGKGRPIFYEIGPRAMLQHARRARGPSQAEVNQAFSRSHENSDSPFIIEVLGPGELQKPGKNVPPEAIASIPIFGKPFPTNRGKYGSQGGEQRTAIVAVPMSITGFEGSTAKLQLIVSANPHTVDKLLICPPPVLQTSESIRAGTIPFQESVDLILNSLTKYQGWRLGATTWNGHVHYAIPFPGYEDMLKRFEHREGDKLLFWCDYSEGFPELETDNPERAASWLESLAPIREDELKVRAWIETKQYEEH
jgi:hypothetical protein